MTLPDMAKVMPLYTGRVGRNTLFTRLVRPHLKAMYRMAYRWTRSRDDAEDLVQETLARLVSHTGEMARVEKLAPWLIKVLYRNFVDFFRQRGRSPGRRAFDQRAGTAAGGEQLAADPGDNGGNQHVSLLHDLQKALETLPEDQRNVVLLHDAEGYSAAETASILGISAGTVKSRLHRARRRLKEFLKPGTY